MDDVVTIRGHLQTCHICYINGPVVTQLKKQVLSNCIADKRNSLSDTRVNSKYRTFRTHSAAVLELQLHV